MRLLMHEYGESIALDDVCAQSGLGLPGVRALFLRASDRLRQGLRLSDLLTVGYDSVRAEGFAGLLRLSSSVELEVVPKFLDPDDPSWRGDFVYLAMMSRWGRILPADGLHVAMGDRTLLANLVAAAVVQLYWDSHRRPLRL
jgi:5-methylcytosine-specific restriction enzyme subunit McrC